MFNMQYSIQPTGILRGKGIPVVTYPRDENALRKVRELCHTARTEMTEHFQDALPRQCGRAVSLTHLVEVN